MKNFNEINRTSMDIGVKKNTFLKSLLVLIGVLITSLTSQVWGTEYKRVYFDKSRWNGGSATFWVRAFKSSNNSQNFDYKIVNTFAGDIMYIDIDTQYDKCVFVRNNSSATAISWSGDAFWGKTGDLTIADGNRYILSDYQNAYSNGDWSTMMELCGGTIYLDNSLLNWNPTGEDKIQFFHGDDSYNYTYVDDMTHITNTQLWYKDIPAGNSAVTYFRFAKAHYGKGYFGSSNVPTTSTGTYCNGTYTFNSGNLYIFTTSNGNTGTSISPAYQSGGYTDLNKTITLAAQIKASNSGSYVAGTSQGQLGASSYSFSNYNTCGTSTGSSSIVAKGGTSGTFTAGYTAATTLSVTNVDAKYTFKGWYDADGNKLSGDATYTGYCSKSTTTVYAYFEENTYNVTAVASPSAGGVVTPSSATAFGRVSGGDITATYNEGYYFTGWTGGSGTYGDASENNTTFTPSANNTTVTATFDYTWAVKGQFPDEEEFVVEHLIEHIGKNANSKDTGYIELTLPANSSIEFKIFARDHSTWWSCSDTETKTEFTYTENNKKPSDICGSDESKKNMKLVTAAGGTYKFAWNITDKKVTIHYPNSYKVTYNANNGSGSVPTDEDYYASGETVTVKGNTGSLTKSNYSTLAYWNTKSDCSGKDCAIGSGTFTITQDTTLYAKWTQSVTLNKNGSANEYKYNGSVTATYNAAGPFSVSAPVRVGYSVEGYYADEECTHKVMTNTGALVNYTGYVEGGKWVHSGATILYAKWVADYFVIYRPGDLEGDSRSTDDAVETYAGGTIAKPIEYRMKVGRLDQWYSLSLPFTVSAVQVWDDYDRQYYDIIPFHRSGGTLYNGHYIIRTPDDPIELPIKDFGLWNDPEEYIGYTPEANTPYIIQWHDSYFSGMYVSFFGDEGQNIDTSFDDGDAPESDENVNIYANNTMHSGTVKGAYVLDPTYGNGAWLRGEKATDDTTVPAFECFVRATETATGSIKILRRDMNPQDQPTGWDDVLNSERKAQIYVYTITGFMVAQFSDNSFSEAAYRLKTSNREGVFILHSENESVKLIIGGK